MKLSFCPFSAFLFASSAAAYTGYLARKAKKTNEKKFDVVFILGGPVRIFAYPFMKVPNNQTYSFSNLYFYSQGAGKGTQCELLSKVRISKTIGN